MSTATARLFMRVFYYWRYLTGKTPWDTNVTPPEVVELIEREQFLRTREGQARALDLGCGTGTNALYLAEHGFEVIGIDFVPRAIARAKHKADALKAKGSPISVEFRAGDVLAPGEFRKPFDLVLDIGCFHSIDAAGRARYAGNVTRWTGPGSLFLVYAFFPYPMLGRTIGVDRAEMERLFGADFELRRYADDERSAWYRWERKE